MSILEIVKRRAAIGGYVRDADSGAGIAGATVELAGDGRQARTRADGFYCFLDLADGSYALHGSAPLLGSRYGAVTVGGVAVGADSDGRPVIDAKGNLELPPTRLTGTVGSSGSSAPIAYADVRLRASNVKVKSGKTGQYVLSAVEAGTQTVQVSASGFAAVSRSVSLTAGQETVANFTLTPS